jgi:hypothetical protein
MIDGAAAGAAAAAAGEEIARAIKASGAIVSVEPDNFMTILGRVDMPLVVCSQSKFLSTKYHYLTAYKGLIFYTKSSTELMLRPSVELIQAKKIWIPG